MTQSNSITFSQEQLEICKISSGNHIVQAPAGCGKTEILSHRIGLAIENGILEEEMICLTFTNKAAREMKDRFSSTGLNFKGFIGNIHNYCNLFLRKNNLISANTSLIDEDENFLMIEGIIKKNQLNCHAKELYIFYCEYKRQISDQGIKHDSTFELFSNHPQKELIIQLYGEYEKLKERFGFITFDDLLTLTIEYLTDGNDYLFSNFTWLQVDEVQDLNAPQWEIIKLISKNASCIVYFGDYEQSIFSFMGAKRDRLKSLYSEAKSTQNYHTLNKNYRSSGDIIKILNQYLKSTIQSEELFLDNTASLDLENKENFKIYSVKGVPEDEFNFISTHILPQFGENEKTAIIFRSNGSAQHFSDTLNEVGISHFKLSGVDFFKRTDIKDLTAFLNCLVNPFDLFSWKRMFSRFAKIESYGESLNFTAQLYSNGFLPADLFDNNVDSYINKFTEAVQHTRVVVFDTETTGLNTNEDDIIQIAATEIINGVIGKSFNVYIKTSKSLENSIETHHISGEILDKEGVMSEKALELFYDFLGENSVVIAHNLEYDIAILKSFTNRNSNRIIHKYIHSSFDTLSVAKLLYPKLIKYKLEYLLTALNLEGVNSHNAIDDVFATCNLVLKLNEDGLKIQAKTNVFIDKYRGNIERFRTNFKSFFNDSRQKLDSEFSLVHLIENFGENFFQRVQLDDSRLQELYKLLASSSEENLDLKQQLIQFLPIYSTLKESDLLNDNAKIIIATPHKAKGLEFDNVIVAESVEGIYPHFLSQKEKDPIKAKEMINEDQRIYYVALSRAKKRIYITSHTKMITKTGQEYSKDLSPFNRSIENSFLGVVVK